MRAFLGKYGLALAFVWVYLYSFPYFERMRHANELPRVYLTQAMVDDGTFVIDAGVRRHGKTADVSRAHGHFYSNKAPGSSFLAAPAYLALKGVNAALGRGEPTLAETTWVCRVFAGIIPALLFLILLSRFLSRFLSRMDDGHDEPHHRDAVRIALCGYGLGSLALIYALQFMAHQLSAVCIGSAYILSVWVIDEKRDPRLLWLVGLAAGCAPLCDYQAAFAGVPLAVYLLVKLGRERRFKHLCFAALGALPPVFALLGYHQACFGSPFKTGYDYSETFAHFHQKGFLGITRLRWEAFYGSTFQPDNGLFVLCPMLLLAVIGWYVMARRRSYWHLGITLSVTVIYLLFISSINFWRGGWQVGPRYVTAMLPFIMVPVTVALSVMARHVALRGLGLALVVTGIVIYSTSAAVFPHFPDHRFSSPLYEVTFRLIGEGHAPYNLGYALGLRGLASLIPLFAVLSVMVVWMALGNRVRLDGGRSALIGISGAALLLALYRVFERGGPVAERAYHTITTFFPT